MTTILLATNNPGKAAEFRSLLADRKELGDVRLLTLSDFPQGIPEVEETGRTFTENARLKASMLAVATNIPALADDSGLCVDALGGAPGVYSARWAGPNANDTDRNNKLLAALAELPDKRRTARFVCAAAFALPSGETVLAEASCEGIILDAPRGTHGFGYDPLFLIPELGRTMAELSKSEKNQISHRALAVANLVVGIASLLAAV